MDYSDDIIILNTASASVDTISTNGQAIFNLGEPLRYYDKHVKVALHTFSYTNFFLNISTALSNNTIYYSDDALDSTKYSITIPDGSYSVESLNSYIQGQLTEDGVAPGLFTIAGDYSSNKVYFTFSATLSGWYLSFEAGTPYTLLGITLDTFIPSDKSNSVNEIVYAAATAAFNNVETVGIKTNLTNNIISSTNRSSLLYQSTPNVTIGSTQTDQLSTLLFADAPSLKQGISQIIINIIDQNDAAISMQENFSVILVVRHG